MAPTDTKTEVPQGVDLLDGTGITSGDGQAVLGRLVDDAEPDPITDAGVPDAIDEAVGAGRGYLAPYTLPELLLPADDDSREAAVFDRMYLPLAGEKPVYVDTVPDGLERARIEAEKHVAEKRAWAKKARLKYLVVVEETVTV